LFYAFIPFYVLSFVFSPWGGFHFFFDAKKETKQRKNPCRKDATRPDYEQMRKIQLKGTIKTIAVIHSVCSSFSSCFG
jgi:hypothetical protein